MKTIYVILHTYGQRHVVSIKDEKEKAQQKFDFEVKNTFDKNGILKGNKYTAENETVELFEKKLR